MAGARKYWELFQSHPIVVFTIGSILVSGMITTAYVSFFAQEREINALEGALLLLTGALIIRVLQYRRSSEFTIREVHGDLVDTFTRLEASEKKNEKLEAQLSAFRDAGYRTPGDITKKIQKLQSEVEQASGSRSRQKAEVENLRKELKSSKASLQDARSEVSKLQSQLSEEKEAHSETNEAKRKAQTALSFAEQRVQELENAISDKENRMNQISESANADKSRMEDLLGRLSALESTLAKFQKRQEKLTQRVRELESRNEEFQSWKGNILSLLGDGTQEGSFLEALSFAIHAIEEAKRSEERKREDVLERGHEGMIARMDAFMDQFEHLQNA